MEGMYSQESHAFHTCSFEELEDSDEIRSVEVVEDSKNSDEVVEYSEAWIPSEPEEMAGYRLLYEIGNHSHNEHKGRLELKR